MPILAFYFACGPMSQPVTGPDLSQEVQFSTTDSVDIIADLHLINEQAPTVILLHQAGANARSEYGPIIPRLVANDFNVLAVDLRSGGQLFGSYNRTVAGIGLNQFTYCDALSDVEAALLFVKEELPTSDIFLWGSSYSAALSIILAARQTDRLAGVLAFSPASGGPMKACSPNPYLEQVDTPLLLLRPRREMEVPSVNEQYALAQTLGHQTYIAEGGVHGSSMLVEARTKQDVSEHFNVVISFLMSATTSAE